MHVLFVHRNFPAQFGHVAPRLVEEGWRCTFVSQTEPGRVEGIEKVQYRVESGATPHTHYTSRTFENAVWHAAAVYEALKPLDLHPDLVVGHSGFGSTLFLTELYPETPVIDYFEFFYHPRNSDLDFRPEWPVKEYDRLRVLARNAMILLDLEYCIAGYSPTEYQRSLLPSAYKPKVRVIHDGIDTALWRRRDVDRAGYGLAEDARVLTYAAHSFEAMRGFDIFMRVAKRVCDADPRVVVLVAGSDQVIYGDDLEHIEEPTFKDHVLAQDAYDLERIRFVGALTPDALAQLFSVSDLHVYLTVPFVLSWSLLDAMACGCTVLASDVAPVREVIRDGETGLLRGFFDVDELVSTALDVLRDPSDYAELGRAAERTIAERYALDVVLPELTAMFEAVVG